MVGSSGEEILPTRRNYSKTFGVVRKVGYIIVGWVLITLVVAGFTGLVRKE
jgi:hypothetical protein